jgi:hypothetical protein
MCKLSWSAETATHSQESPEEEGENREPGRLVIKASIKIIWIWPKAYKPVRVQNLNRYVENLHMIQVAMILAVAGKLVINIYKMQFGCRCG